MMEERDKTCSELLCGGAEVHMISELSDTEFSLVYGLLLSLAHKREQEQSPRG